MENMDEYMKCLDEIAKCNHIIDYENIDEF